MRASLSHAILAVLSLALGLYAGAHGRKAADEAPRAPVSTCTPISIRTPGLGPIDPSTREVCATDAEMGRLVREGIVASDAQHTDGARAIETVLRWRGEGR